ncbi:hypothetical protein B5K05_33225 [Rhizobium phaseoli]|uniref:hypothetical protein n=1 Tax=Rhizobium phaseoli TaxID=396 RepID=UPI000E0D1DB1|nr:hypothetical protein [Rhizobium phaseoli]RDJ00735.1 hypothetical protein B5K05_33225 [Rhizobium phaseoli]RDJ00935.1 hypothetical protein B5K04_31310 [Rhizobium phaseoli]
MIRVSLAIVILISFDVSAAHSQAKDCSLADKRTEFAFQRAARSLARVRVARLRVAHELSVGAELLPDAVAPVERIPPSVLKDLPNEQLSVAVWQLSNVSSAMATVVTQVTRRMANIETPEPIVKAPVPDLDDQIEALPMGERATNCAAWARYAELGALRAEQASQLADVAVEQSIARSKRFFSTMIEH